MKKWVLVVVAGITAIGIIGGFMLKSRIEVTSTFSVNVDRIKVFEKLVDFESIPKWNSSVLSSKMLSNNSGVGSEFIEKRKELFSTSDMKFRVLESKPGEFLKVQGQSGQTTIQFEFSVQELNHETQVQLRFIEMPKPRILAALLRPIYQRSVDANMAKLKALML